MMRYYLRCALAVLGKDITCELRTRHALGAILLFAITSTIAVSFTLSGWGSKSEIASALLWIVLYFSAMSGLGRSFVHEEEMGTAALIKFSMRPNSVYLGKLAFNWMLLLCVQIVTVPLFVMLMGCSVDHWGAFVALLLVGSLALSAGATLAAAMVARASVKGALFAVISFPLLVPVLTSAIHGTGLAMSGHGAASDIKMLAYYSGTVITASLMLFKFIWED